MEFAHATLEITPAGSVTLAGTTRRVLSSGIAEPLEANIVAIRTAPGEIPILIVTLDLLYPGRMIRNLIERSFPDIPPHNILLAASHTHRGPMTDDTKPLLGSVDLHYVNQIGAALAGTQMVVSGMHWKPGVLTAGQAQAEGGINRRLRKRLVIARSPRLNAVVNAPNPGGYKDETVNVLIGEATDGHPLFVLWSYACHPVGFPARDQIAAHFPYVVREKLRELYNDTELTVGFLQGFSGNIRPSETATPSGFSRRVRRILTGPIFSDMSWASYGSWSSRLASTVNAAVASANTVIIDDITAKRVLLDGRLFVNGAGDSVVTFQAIKFSSVLYLVGVSAEVVSEYVPMVQAMVPDAVVICVGCLDHTFGYAPTRSIIQEGGYEAGGYCGAFSLESVNPQIQEEMRRGFDSVLRE